MVLIRRVVLGISGGVDSAVAGLILKKKGFDVIGVFMRNWDIKDEQGLCSVDQDVEDAEWVCKQLQIPFREANFVKEYWNEVFSYLLEEYQNGRTPNPDIYCNKYIKFNHFAKFAQEKFEADAIATGHYARSSFGDHLEHYVPVKDAKLLQAVDRIKDQTFFLSQIPQKALRMTMFPLGHMTKEVVFKIARMEGLDRIAEKVESTGICFIGKRDFSAFISEYIKDTPGDFVDMETRKKVGEHRGFHHWTLGQRSKIQGFPWRYYTHSKEVETNAIYVVRGSYHPSLYSSTLHVKPFQWIHQVPEQLFSKGQFECKFRFQHTHPLVSCVVAPVFSNSEELTTLLKSPCAISLAEPLRALTPGQFSVIYDGEVCLGSAIIESIGPSLYELSSVKDRVTHKAQTGTRDS